MKKNEYLKNIKNELKTIGVYTDEDRLKIVKESQEIDRRVMLSNQKLKLYKSLCAVKKDSFDRVDLALDIQFENAQILNEKFKVMQFIYQDIYKRIELLGEKITQLTDYVEGEAEHGR